MKKLILTLAVLGGSILAATAQPDINTRNYAFALIQPESPVFEGDSIVFKVYAPEARRVCITGSWENFYTENLMEKGDDGIWTYKIAMLPPEIYQYVYDIDGMVVLDPGNYSQTRDMYNYRSNLIIRGPESEPYFSQSSSQHGVLEKVWYQSESFGAQRRMSVYLPYGYDASDKSKTYPVLYLLHGGGGDEEAWPTLGRLCEIMDYMIEKKLCKPMIVVTPNINSYELAACETALPEKFIFNLQDPEFAAGDKFCNDLLYSIIPYIEEHYNTDGTKQNRGIAGLSMGGFMTMKLIGEHPDYFNEVGVFSSGSMGGDDAAAVKALKKDGYNNFMVVCGPNDIAYRGALGLVDNLKAADMDFSFISDLETGHVWQTWRKCLLWFAPEIF